MCNKHSGSVCGGIWTNSWLMAPFQGGENNVWLMARGLFQSFLNIIRLAIFSSKKLNNCSNSALSLWFQQFAILHYLLQYLFVFIILVLFLLFLDANPCLLICHVHKAHLCAIPRNQLNGTIFLNCRTASSSSWNMSMEETWCFRFNVHGNLTSLAPASMQRRSHQHSCFSTNMASSTGTFSLIWK